MINIPLVSVIIPIYKVEKYLIGCVNSVLTQTYGNIEIILVDDGSPDNCPEICDEFARKYSNISVIHKANGGLSEARNYGLDKVRGEYVLFLDSDDQLFENAIMGLIHLGLKTNADVIIPDRYLRIDENTRSEKTCFHFKKVNEIEKSTNFALNIIIGRARAWRASALMYKTALIIENKIEFPVGYIAEDIVFNLLILSKANFVAIYKESTLRNLKRGGSITTTFQESLGSVFLFIDKKVNEFLITTKNNDVAGLTKQDELLCRNTIVYISALFSKRCKWSYSKKVKIADDYLKLNRIESAFSIIKINPYFESTIKRIYFRIMFSLIKYKYKKIAYQIAALAGRI